MEPKFLNLSPSFLEVDFAIYGHPSGTFWVKEKGVEKYRSSNQNLYYNKNSLLKIIFENGRMRYYFDDYVFYQSFEVVTGPYYAMARLWELETRLSMSYVCPSNQNKIGSTPAIFLKCSVFQLGHA